MRKRLDSEAPLERENWPEVFKDIERIIFEGSFQWQSANNFGYFPAACSYPSCLADLLIGAAGQVGFTWVRSVIT